MQERHKNRNKYFREQAYTTEKYCIPFIQEVLPVGSTQKVLEVGCGEGGNLMPFLDLGCECVGIDIACNKIDNGIKYFEDHNHYSNLRLMCQDFFTWETEEKFDLIYLRDVLEHLPKRDVFMGKVKHLLKPGGKMFLGFPPWQNPFGGHQQICENKLLSKLPFYHLLPRPLYKWLLRMGGESAARIEGLMEVRDTRISIGEFYRLVKNNNYGIDRQLFFLFNPNYQIKFGLKPRKQPLYFVPFLRNFIITTCYFVVSPK
jgi:SAM-dependent methyltransferase